MKPGEVANGKKFDKGLSEVQNAYGSHGHIQLRMKPTPEYDETGAKVTFKIAINEGPQYRMGAVEFKGFSAGDAARLTKNWNLKKGEVYDQTYVSRFLRDGAGEIMTRFAIDRLSQGNPVPYLGTTEQPNRETLIVDLTIELKN
jgi:outer membrane protein assembly factor BamA